MRDLKPLEVRLLRRLREKLPGTKRLLVACSGGPDSVALLRAAERLRSRMGWTVSAFHLNHQLRPGADEDERFVQALCQSLGIDLATRTVDVAGEAAKKGANLEQEARRIRYRLLLAEADRQGAAAATAHTLDDQAETLLMRLFRGAGPSGLSGVRETWRQAKGLPATLIRPLLAFRRRELRDYLDQLRQDFRLDESNCDERYDRIWIRARLIPIIEERLNPNLVEALGRSRRIFKEIEDFLSREGEGLLESFRSVSAMPELLVQPLLDQHPAVRREVLRQVLASLQEDRPFASRFTGAGGWNQVDALMRLLRKPAGGEVALSGGLQAVKEFDRLRFAERRAVGGFHYGMAVPGVLEIPQLGKRLTISAQAQPRPAGTADRSVRGSQSLVFLPPGIERIGVRNRRPGDVFSLSDRARARKLKRFLLEKRIPRTERDRLIILEVDGRLVWVEGLPSPTADGGNSKIFAVRVEEMKPGGAQGF